MLTGGPSANGPPDLPLRPPTHISAQSSLSASDRDTYERKVQDELREWQIKLADFSKKTETNGRNASVAAQHDLNMAWAQTELEANRLQSVDRKDWDSAKTAYENASRELAATWEKIRPNYE